MHLVRCGLLVLLAVASRASPAPAQRPDPMAAPWTFATIPAGTRVRVVDIHGERLEARVAATSDTALWLRGDDAAVRPTIHVRDVRTLEVHAAPASRWRMGQIGAGIGAVLGALAGVAAHGNQNGAGPGFGDKTGKAENVIVGASMGALAGWAVGRFAVGRSRWQRVALP
jgi:hypothetical protein